MLLTFFYLNYKGIGRSAETYAYVIGYPFLKSVDPTSGSTKGGTVLSLIGNGFTIDTSIKIDTVVCTVTSASIDEITCITSAHVEAVSNIEIM